MKPTTKFYYAGQPSRLSNKRILRYFIFIVVLIFPAITYASFVESTIGTAVVNDATATFYNPAALTLLKNPQIISLNSYSLFRNNFTGQITQNNFKESGSSNSQTNYFLPSLYFGLPTAKKFTLGLAIISNSFNKDFEGNSILRYAQSSSRVQNIDFVPALGIRLNEYFSLGAGLNFSRLNMLLNPIFGFPRLNIPDSEGHNESSGDGWGGDIGVLVKPRKGTLMGLNYRTAITYPMSGTSTLESNPPLVSNNYQFKIWTPASAVFTISQAATKALGFIGTIHYIQWNIFKDIQINGIATPRGIINATAHYHLHNSWVLTAGSQYKITPKLVLRAASSYVQSPASGRYQISNGDSLILGASMGYEITKNISIDGSYAHSFIRGKPIDITSGRNTIIGVNQAARDGVSLKLTINI
jgi:long-chain fatty acid transport protein